MALKDRIKEARNNNHLTQEQLAFKLGIAKSTLAGYETGSREPSIEMFGKLMAILDVDANYLYQDEMDALGGSPMQLKYSEMKHIEKYRDLDPHGKEMVDLVLEKEHARSTSNVVQLSRPDEKEHLIPNAANAKNYEKASDELKQQEDAIMDDENF